jgi:hypothetical protein
MPAAVWRSRAAGAAVAYAGARFLCDDFAVARGVGERDAGSATSGNLN